jgi:hypothetical protein
MTVLRSLLFVFDIENTRDEKREEVIVSKDVNDEYELAELFDILLRPEFFIYRADERQWFIDTLVYFLEANDSFDGVFAKMTTYFDEDVKDQRKFMEVLLGCLQRYQADALGKS